MINLIPQYQKRRLVQLLHTQQGVQLGFTLGEAFGVLGVDHEDDAGDFGEVVFPQPARLLVPAEVEGGEAAGADGEFFARGVEGGLEDCYAVVFEHVEELGGLCVLGRVRRMLIQVFVSYCCFAGVVEAEEEEFGVFICQPELG